MRILLIVIIFAVTGYVGVSIFANQMKEDKLRAAEAQAGVQKAGNTLAEPEDVINKDMIEQTLSEDEKEVFDAEDVSDMAVTEEEDKTIDAALEAVKEKDSIFSAVSYKDLDLYNVNTQEHLQVTFQVNGIYIPTALDRLDQFMRDWRRDHVIDIDPALYVLLHDLHGEVDANKPIHLISGHRSKKTNDRLRAMGRNTAKKSQHVLGKAADITIPGVPVKELREEALEMEKGGVGYYPQDGFIHVDTGRVRQW